LHRVDVPDGARYQLTFGEEPVGRVLRQPNSKLLALTRDKGGDEFDQVYLLNPEDGLMRMLSDGIALNNRMAWDRQGQTVWYMNALNEGHGYAKKENRDLYQQATFLFLQKYLLSQD
jgi:sugar lactone lactonase YvrE